MIRPRYIIQREPVLGWSCYYADGTVIRSREGAVPADVVDGVQALVIVSRRSDGKDFAEVHFGEGGAVVTYDIPAGRGVRTVRSGPLLEDRVADDLYEIASDDAGARRI